MQQEGGAATIQLRWTAAPGRGRLAGLHEEALRPGDLAVEVARVERGAPDDLVHAAQLGDGELLPAERRGQRGVLELGPSAFQPVAQYPLVVEGHLGQCAYRLPAHLGLVRGREV